MLMNDRKTINSAIYNIIFSTIILLTFFAPKMGNRDYIEIIVVYLFIALFSLITKIIFDKIVLSIILYSFIFITIDLINMFTYSSSVLYVIRIFIYALIPIVSYLVGKILSTKVDVAFFNKLIVFVGVVQAIFGLLQVYSDKFRIFSLINYADFEK